MVGWRGATRLVTTAQTAAQVHFILKKMRRRFAPNTSEDAWGTLWTNRSEFRLGNKDKEIQKSEQTNSSSVKEHKGAKGEQLYTKKPQSIKGGALCKTGSLHVQSDDSPGVFSIYSASLACQSSPQKREKSVCC